MIRINLLPVREARRRADLQQQGMLLALLLVLLFAGIGYFHMSIRGQVETAETRVVATKAQIKKYDKQLAKVAEYKKNKKAVQDKLDVIHGLDRSRSGPVRVLDELATRTPDRLWIKSLRSNGQFLTLEGLSLDNEIVALFLTQLGDSEYFDGVELKQTELQSRAGLKLHSFKVTARLVDPERKARAEEEARKKAEKQASAAPDASRAVAAAVGR